MPTTRSRSSRSSSGAGGKQSTLSFKHKVTKAIKTGKEEYKSPSRTKEYIPKPSPEPSKDTKPDADSDNDDVSQVQTPTTPASATDSEKQQQQHDRPLRQIEQQAQAALAQPAKSEEELQAEKITDRAIERYWAGIEASRMAKAVHKKHGEGLSTGEKVLRYFDVSSQYGVRIPSVIITRVRWGRLGEANMLW
jgi:DNA polymerase delta subunit 4